jgi:hypothetical protein
MITKIQKYLPAVAYSKLMAIENKAKTSKKLKELFVLSRVDRFFLVQHTKTGKIYQITTKYTERPYNVPNGRQIFQMAINYPTFSNSMALQNLPKL